MREFEWDIHNVGHVARHGITPDEVEQTFEHPYVEIPVEPIRGEPRWKLFGMTDAGRHVTVVFAIRGSRTRPVTAYTTHRSDRRKYGAKTE